MCRLEWLFNRVCTFIRVLLSKPDPNKSVQAGKKLGKNKRACMFIRNTRVPTRDTD